jgi:hypothetical protein
VDGPLGHSTRSRDGMLGKTSRHSAAVRRNRIRATCEEGVGKPIGRYQHPGWTSRESATPGEETDGSRPVDSQ